MATEIKSERLSNITFEGELYNSIEECSRISDKLKNMKKDYLTLIKLHKGMISLKKLEVGLNTSLLSIQERKIHQYKLSPESSEETTKFISLLREPIKEKDSKGSFTNLFYLKKVLACLNRQGAMVSSVMESHEDEIEETISTMQKTFLNTVTAFIDELEAHSETMHLIKRDLSETKKNNSSIEEEFIKKKEGLSEASIRRLSEQANLQKKNFLILEKRSQVVSKEFRDFYGNTKGIIIELEKEVRQLDKNLANVLLMYRMNEHSSCVQSLNELYLEMKKEDENAKK